MAIREAKNVKVDEEAGKMFPKEKPYPEKRGRRISASKSMNTGGEVHFDLLMGRDSGSS